MTKKNTSKKETSSTEQSAFNVGIDADVMTQFRSITPAILGMGFDSLLSNFVKLKKMETDEILDVLAYSKAEELETPSVNTKRMMCVQELVNRGDADKLISAL